MNIPNFLKRYLPLWTHICPKCRKEVKANSHECPYCGEKYPLTLKVPFAGLHDAKKLEAYVHKHIFPRVSAFERHYLTRFFTTFLTSGWENSGGTDLTDGGTWTGSSSTGAANTIVTSSNIIFADSFNALPGPWENVFNNGGTISLSSDAYSAPYSEDVTAPANGGYDHYEHNFGKNYTNASVIGAVKFISRLTTAPSYLSPFGFETGAGIYANGCPSTYCDGSGNVYWAVEYPLNDGSTRSQGVTWIQYVSSTPVTLNAWHVVRLDWVSAVSGSITLTVDGTVIISITGIDTHLAPANGVWAGHWSSYNVPNAAIELENDSIQVINNGTLSPTHSGIYGYELDNLKNSGDFGYVYKTLTGHSTLYARNYYYFNNALPTASSFVLGAESTHLLHRRNNPTCSRTDFQFRHK